MDKFDIEENGYSINQVNNFINDVIRETEGIITRCKEQKETISKLEERLTIEYNKRVELEQSIDIVKESSNTIRKMAEEQARLTILDAKSNASRIVNEALLKADRIEKEGERYKQNIRMLKRKVNQIIDEQKAIAEEIEVLDLY